MNPESRETDGAKTWQRPEGGDMDNIEKSTADLRKSCDLCCSRKRRCDGDGYNACSLCSSKGQRCTYSKKERRGPKPKPKRRRDPFDSISRDGDVMHLEEGGDPSVPEWEVEGQHGGSQSPPLKTSRITEIVRLSPPRAKGTLGLAENKHLDAFFSGFGACTQIVQEDEIRGAMIHILTEGQFGMPNVEGKSFYIPAPVSSYPEKRAGGNGDHSADDQHLTDLPMIRMAGGGLGIPIGDPMEGSGSAEDLRQRAQRARLSAGVACLWAGIGVGAMLSGHTAEATLHYAENAREAIKGCFDVVSEEVLRAFLCLAHMHSFREDFQKFFRYTTMAKSVEASLDRQGEEAASASASQPGESSGPQPKGCSEPAKFLLKCFEAMGDFLELEGEDINPCSESGSVSRRLSSTSSAAGAGGKPSANGEAGADVAEMEEADEANGVNGEEGGGWRSRLATVAGGKGDGSGNPLNPGALNGGMSTNLAATGLRSPQALDTESDENPGHASAVRVQECVSGLKDNRMALSLKAFARPRQGGPSSGRGRECGPQRWGQGTSNTEHQHQAQQQQLSSSGGAMVASDGDWMSGVDSANSGGGEGGGGGGGGWGLGSSPSFKEESHLVNQVLFVGDTRILEVSMSVDLSCIDVMSKAVSKKVDWAEVAEDARVVANTADAILVPVLASSSISQSICAVKLLADSAFSHLCLGNADAALRAMRRFCAILKKFPGIMRFPPWRHCFHWMAGMLESADLRNEYNCLRDGLVKINMKSMKTLPEFGKAAHDVMCKCPHVRCQATHKALAEHAKRDPYGSFRVPPHCPQYGTAAKSVSEGNSMAFRQGFEASQWAERLDTAASSSGACGAHTGNSDGFVHQGVGVAPGRLPTAITTISTSTALPPSPLSPTLAAASAARMVTATIAGKSRRGAVTAKTAAEAASVAATRRPSARTVSISESEPGSMSPSPSSKPASQPSVVGSPPLVSPVKRPGITTRARRGARMPSGGRQSTRPSGQVSPRDGRGGEAGTGRGTGGKELSVRPQLGPREVTESAGAHEAASTVAEGAAGSAGAVEAASRGAQDGIQDDISRSASGGVHPESFEANNWSTKYAGANGQQRPSRPVSGSSFDVFAEVEPLNLDSGFGSNLPISVGSHPTSSGPMVPGDASPAICSGQTVDQHRTTSSSSVLCNTSEGDSAATPTPTWLSGNNASSALPNPGMYNPSGPAVSGEASVTTTRGIKSRSQHSTNSNGAFCISSGGSGSRSSSATTSMSTTTWPSVEDPSPAPPIPGACGQSDLRTTLSNFTPAFGGGGGSPPGIPMNGTSAPYGSAGGTMYGSPTVDSVVEGGGFANSGVGGTGFNSPMGGRNSPRVYSTARSASVGSGINLPAHGGTGGAALVPGSSSGFGVGRSMLGVTSSTGFGSGPSVGRGNVQINGFSPGIATTVPGNSLTSGPGNGFATGPGNVNLGGPWLPINRSFNLGQTSTSFGVGEVSNAPSNGASIGSPRGDGVHSNGVAASELHQQLWEILNDPDVEMNTVQQMHAGGGGHEQSVLEDFTETFAGMLTEEESNT